MAFGMRPVRRLSGTDYQGDLSPYELLNTQSAIGYGAPVTWHTDGTVKTAAAGEDLIGVFCGCRWSGGSAGALPFSPNWAGSDATKINPVALVADSPDLVFEIETSTNWGAVAAPVSEWRGLACDIYVPGTSIDANGMSLIQLQEWYEDSTEGVLKTYRLSPKATVGGTNQIMEVIIVKHALLTLTSRTSPPTS